MSEIPYGITEIGVRSLAGERAYGLGHTLYGEPETEIFVIPETVKVIRPEAFLYNAHIKSITIPSSVELISGGAFLWCRNLEKIEFMNENVIFSSMGSDGTSNMPIFKYCTNLNEIIPKSLYNENTAFHFEMTKISDIEDKRQKNIKDNNENATKMKWRSENKCQYCGSNFKGLITKVCSTCSKPKDY